jgi:hypothetical protein
MMSPHLEPTRRPERVPFLKNEARPGDHPLRTQTGSGSRFTWRAASVPSSICLRPSHLVPLVVDYKQFEVIRR